MLDEVAVVLATLECKVLSSRKVTSRKIARQASAVLRDGRSGKRTRSIAGSALAQAKSKSK